MDQTATADSKDTAPVSWRSSRGHAKVRIMIHIRMSNGMQLSGKNMDYRELRELVDKLEGLC